MPETGAALVTAVDRCESGDYEPSIREVYDTAISAVEGSLSGQSLLTVDTGSEDLKQLRATAQTHSLRIGIREDFRDADSRCCRSSHTIFEGHKCSCD
jgi:hypothetical protein